MIASVSQLDRGATRCRSRSRQLVLAVEFESPNGARWSAIGGGSTVAEALGSAGEALPAGRWTPVAWNDLYGD
jgi:hypothetical protein